MQLDEALLARLLAKEQRVAETTLHASRQSLMQEMQGKTLAEVASALTAHRYPREAETDGDRRKGSMRESLASCAPRPTGCCSSTLSVRKLKIWCRAAQAFSSVRIQLSDKPHRADGRVSRERVLMKELGDEDYDAD